MYNIAGIDLELHELLEVLLMKRFFLIPISFSWKGLEPKMKAFSHSLCHPFAITDGLGLGVLQNRGRFRFNSNSRRFLRLGDRMGHKRDFLSCILWEKKGLNRCPVQLCSFLSQNRRLMWFMNIRMRESAFTIFILCFFGPPDVEMKTFLCDGGDSRNFVSNDTPRSDPFYFGELKSLGTFSSIF